ncbi:amino acid adenylation domain-containing protein [Kroppenstedtia pulmonis]|uniref:Amino acid adenylation domain-containing protein n=1 Tax=Kroppenstedtia pulmonis TaxID=1380685 RepID=A0A7D4C722_9BACL|nr:non-ribosomal peptide synthase/polyketide synthase [Kroppenstedtia pulmonis]QKG84716.1 amino acid adenylation domain-containing protein [Kroppenstedtia pulmonis]
MRVWLWGELNEEKLRVGWKQAAERHLKPLGWHSVHVYWKDWGDLKEAQKQECLNTLRNGIKESGDEPHLIGIRWSKERHLLVLWHHVADLDVESGRDLLRKVIHSAGDGVCHEVSEENPNLSFSSKYKEGDRKAEVAYWKDYLAGFPSATPLGLEQSSEREEDRTEDSVEYICQLTKGESEEWQSLAKRNGWSLETLLEGAWAVLLSRYSGEKEVLFGTKYHVQSPREEGWPRWLPLRVSVPGDSSGKGLFDHLEEDRVLRIFHGSCPAEDIRHASEVPGKYPLFESGVSVDRSTLSGKMVEKEERVGPAVMAVVLEWAVCDQAEIRLRVDPRRIDRDTALRILGHVRSVLSGLIHEPEQTLSAISCLTAEELKLWEKWQGGMRNFSADQTLIELFEQQVRLYPEAPALQYGEESLTYRELNQRSNRLAHYLRSWGVGPDNLVGLCVDRSKDLVVGILGILKAGGAYVPLDPANPEERLAYIVNDTQISIVVTQRCMSEKLSQTDYRQVLLDGDELTGLPLRDDNPVSGGTTENLAYVIYTSGSTGKPKGVMVSHKNVVRLFSSTKSWFEFDKNDVWTLFHSYAFDFAVWEMWGALLHGGKLVIVPYEVSRSPEDFYRLLVQEKVTVLNQTPSAFRQLIEAEARIGVPDALALRFVIFGGEALDIPMLRPWFDRHGDSTPRLINMYGITETTVHVTYYPLTIADLDSSQGSVIGKPIPDLKVRLMDIHGQLTPVGVIGEMYVGGDGVARGYLNRPDLTKERFMDHPFSNVSEGRMYRTGDLARLLSDGNLEYIGRVDHQVKIRGFRIELGEIESVLTQHEEVKEALVLVQEDEKSDKRLVAYIVAEEGTTTAVIRNHLLKMLPGHMIPAHFVFLPVFPLTPNGKIDRKALPAPDFTLSDLEYTAPRNNDEKKVADLFAEVLGTDRVGIHHSFFEMGGHSLLATKVLLRFRDLFGTTVSFPIFFEFPTVAELVPLLVRNRKEEMSAPPLVPVNREDTLPLSFAQQRLWFIDRVVSRKELYNLPYAWRICGNLNTEALQQAFNHLLERHEVLRTVIREVEGEGRQVILPFKETELPVLDWCFKEQNQRESDWSLWIRQEADHVFDLSQGPLIRTHLIRMEEEEYILVCNMHHIVSDGWSMGIFLQEWFRLYEEYAEGVPAGLEELPVQYADFAVWQRKWMSGEISEKQLAYWKKELAGDLPVLQLPHDYPRPAVQSYEGACHRIRLPGKLKERLVEFGRNEGATLFMTLMAAYQGFLSRYTGQEEVLVGSPVANRNHEKIEGLIGFFVNTLVFRSDVSDKPSFRELLARVRGKALAAFANQDVPFEKVVDEVMPERSSSYSPLFQTLFVLQNASIQKVSLKGLEVESLEIEQTTSKFDLTLSVEEENKELTVSFEYNRSLFHGDTIRRFAEHFHHWLEQVLQYPNERLNHLSWITEEEREQVVTTWNRTTRSYPKQASLAVLFEEQVQRRPKAVALVSQGETVTYKELNRQANQIAHTLIRRGIGPESRVGLCLERSTDMVAGLLGILKAGGAYVPLDPEYPRERLVLMMEDAQPEVVLTRNKWLSTLPLSREEMLCLDLDAATIQQAPVTNPETGVKGDNLAYLIYTSGSTGVPKGVVVPQQGVTRLVKNNPFVTVTAEDVFLQASTINFDAATFEIWGSLLNGASLVLMPPSPSAEDWERVIRTHKVSVLWLTAGLFNLLVEEQVEALQGVKQLLVGGDALSVPHVKKALAALPDTTLINGYGPTENTTFTCCHRITEVDGERGSIPIGVPIANTQVYVLDDQGHPVPVGVAGEMYVGGDGLARGYWNRPELTESAFVANPFVPGEKLYRTGDQVRWLPDGTLEFVGRVDQQVKIRGFRIEPGEIEAVLAEHPSVKTAAVTVMEEGEGEKKLAAYASVETGTKASELREYLKERLPGYMMPAYVTVLPKMPLTPNGKVDRRALPQPDPIDVSENYVAPRNEQEQTLAKIWCQVLHLEKVGIHDNFFSIGGDSILSIQIAARAKQNGWTLTPHQMFKHQTIAELATVMKQTEQISASQGLVVGDVPLTPIQQWFVEQDLPQPHHWNQSVTVYSRKGINITALEQAFNTLVRHHDALRLRYGKNPDGSWTQRIEGEEKIGIEVVDLSGKSPEKREKMIREGEAKAQSGLNLWKGPLWRVVVFLSGDSEPDRLFFVVHHLAIDGVSWRILLEDLETVYGQLCEGKPVQLPAKTTSYQQWAQTLKSHVDSDTVRNASTFWLEMSADFVDDSLPLDRPEGRNQEKDAQRVTVSLDEEETRSLLQDVPAAYRTQMNDVLLTALVQSMKGWTGKDDLWVHMEGHGREEVDGVDLSRTVGWFTSIYPVHLKLNGAGDAGEALKLIKEQLRSIPNKGFDYGLLRYLDPELSDTLRKQPTPSISFNYLGRFDSGESGSGMFLLGDAFGEGDWHPESLRPHAIDVVAMVKNGQLNITWIYSGKQLDRSTMEQLANDYKTALRRLLVHCTQGEVFGYTPSDFPLSQWSQKELDTFIGDRRDVQQVYPLTPLQHGMLFHSWYDDAGGDYITQWTADLQGTFDFQAFKRAWHKVVERHDIFRTAFIGSPTVQQVVYSTAPVDVNLVDWIKVGSEEREERLEMFLKQDRKQGFDWESPPVMRLTVIRLETDLHRFVWSHHHALLDGWSLSLVLNDLFHLYETETRGDFPKLETPRPFGEYMAWLQSRDLEKAEAFWRQELKGFTAPTPLPLAKREAEEAGVEEVHFHLSEKETETLNRWARSNQLTLNTVIQGAWAYLLSRYTGEEEVVFGTTSSGRPADMEAVEQMVGLFINTLPFRVEVKRDRPVVEWLRQLQERQLEIRQYEYSPLVKVQAWSELPGGVPLFNTVFVFENYPDHGDKGDRELQVANVRGLEQTNYPLGLSVTPGKQLSLKWMYDRSQFDRDTVKRMSGHLLSVLLNMTGQKKTSVGALSYLTDAERKQHLVEWNQTQTHSSGQRTVHGWFEEQVAKTPDHAAVSFEGDILTYDQLNRYANRLAHFLIETGITPESRVGLCMDSSPEMVVGILGVLKAGAAYVPMDPQYPEERLNYMVEHAEVSLVLSCEAMTGNVPGNAPKVVCIDRDLPDTGKESNPVNKVESHQLAYVIYTSGSTGQPKGVMVEHRSVVNVLQGLIPLFDVQTGDRVLQFTSISFDVSVSEIGMALLSGATLLLEKKENLMPGPGLIRILREQRVQVVSLPMSVLAALPPADLPDLKTLAVGGDACSQELVVIWGQGRRLFNCYGPTETTVTATSYLCQGESGHPPIGRPIANVEAYVLDSDLHPVPVGVPGELYLGGAGLARGYLNQPDLTAERFISHPFQQGSNARLYRTGDRVRYLPDGNLEFIGRMDHQVKIRGFRIEPGEIESTLLNHKGVEEAVVLAKEIEPGDKRLVAYVVLEDTDVKQLRDYLKERLPNHMVPSYLIPLSQMPLTTNGKVDRKSLPEPKSQADLVESMLPQTPTEELVTSVFSKVLGMERLGREASFFDNGGHSLLATKAIMQIQETLRVDLPLRLLFEKPTVRELAGEIDGIRLSGSPGNEIQLKPVDRRRELPLSYAQQRLWFFERLNPSSSLYNIPWAARIEGELQTEALKRAWVKLMNRHEVLRTVIREEKGEALQVIQKEPAVEFRLEDWTHLSKEVREERLKEELQDEASQPFDLSQGPLLRGRVIRTDHHEHVLMCTLHHIISDGWSMDVFMREWFSLYREVMSGIPADLEELPVQYADFAVWQRKWLDQGVMERQLDYWRRELSGELPVLGLPADRPRPSVQTHAGALYFMDIPEAVLSGLYEVGKQEGATLFMTLLAAYQGFLSRYTGQDDILVGSPVANRNQPGLENLIGFFVNTLVFRTNLSDQPSFRQLLGNVREKALDAYANQDVPFERVVEDIQPERDLSHSPVFQTMFILQNMVHVPQPEGLTLTSLDSGHVMANFDLTLTMEEQNGGLTARFEYNRDLFDAATIEQMANHFQSWLASIAADPDVRIGEKSLLSEEEAKGILEEWNDTDRPNRLKGSVPSLVEKRAEEAPDAIALVDGQRRITYRELNEGANRLARQLLKRGVKREDRVAVCADRSPEAIMGLLATWKAGAAFVPMDPSYPQERLVYMMTDADVRVLLADTSSGELLASHVPDWIRLDTESVTQGEGDNLHRITDSDQLAYVLYTSGSTGQPKGVMVEHQSLMNLVEWHCEAYSLTEADHSTHLAGSAFDASVWEIWPVLASGACLHLVDEETRLSPERLRDWLVDNKITVSFLPTPLAEQIMTLDWPEYTSLRVMLTGGDRLRHRPPAGLPFVLMNHYGPTENTVVSTVARIHPGTGVPPIGKPIANTRVYVLDAYGHPVPVGVPGELYLGGIGLARGYWNRPELTESTFVADPFGEPGGKLYRTGDLVRWLPDGNLEFIRRVDQQMNIRGFRIEPGEIEGTLLEHPDVQEALVLLREDRPGEKRLVGYVTGSATAQELREHAKNRLPAYMVPAPIVVLEAFPLTPNGKVDRQALPIPDEKMWEEGHVEPRTEKERVLADIWETVLGSSPVGVHDNFFERGGDSILSIQIVARANQAGLRLTPRQLFEHQTIAELAQAAGEGEQVKAEQGMVTGDVPLTPIQTWFFEQHHPNPHHWNQSMLLTVKEPMDPKRLGQALKVLSDHHDALRLRFTQDGDHWFQENGEAESFVPLTVSDLSGYPEEKRQEKMDSVIAEAQRGLDITEGPLWQAVMIRLGQDCPDRLFLVIHHLAVDGVSWRILLEDLETIYQQLEAGETVNLPAKTTSYREWAHRLKERVETKAVSKARNYWMEEIQKGATPLLVDHPEGDDATRFLDEVKVLLSSHETETLLREVVPSHRAGINDVLLMALVRGMTDWTGSPALWVNLEGHGREEILEGVDLSRTVGWFTSLYPVRLDLSGAKEPVECLKRVKEQLRRIPDKGVDFGILWRFDPAFADMVRDLPEPAISFNYLGQMDSSVSDTALFAGTSDSSRFNVCPDSSQPHLLDVVGVVTNGQLQVTWMFSKDKIRRDRVEKAAMKMLTEIRALLTPSESRANAFTVSDFPDADLSQGDLSKVLAKLNKGKGR